MSSVGHTNLCHEPQGAIWSKDFEAMLEGRKSAPDVQPASKEEPKIQYAVIDGLSPWELFAQ